MLCRRFLLDIREISTVHAHIERKPGILLLCHPVIHPCIFTESPTGPTDARGMEINAVPISAAADLTKSPEKGEWPRSHAHCTKQSFTWIPAS